jgi:hypothetical protein
MSSLSSSSSTAGSRALQETLHVLLTRISATMEHVQNWPSEQQAQAQQGNSSNKSPTGTAAGTGTETNIHVSSTTQLIQHLNHVVTALQRVEGTVRSDAGLRKSLQECPIPVDLLDLLDSSKLHPDVFARGLLREALGQLAGLRRRKLALEMLGSAIQSGIHRRKRRRKLLLQQQVSEAEASSTRPEAEAAPAEDGTLATAAATTATATATNATDPSSALPAATRERTC